MKTTTNKNNMNLFKNFFLDIISCIFVESSKSSLMDFNSLILKSGLIS